MAMMARACPDYRFEETEPAYASQTRTEATVPWRCTGTVTGSLVPPGFATTGNSIQLHGDEHWEFRGGLLCRWLAVERCLPTAWRGADLTR